MRRWNNAQAPFPCGRIHRTLNSCSDPVFVIRITFVITLYWCTYTGFSPGFFSQESELEWQNVGPESWRFCQNCDWQANISGVAFYYLATQQKKKKKEKLPQREDFNILWLGFNAKYNKKFSPTSLAYNRFGIFVFIIIILFLRCCHVGMGGGGGGGIGGGGGRLGAGVCVMHGGGGGGGNVSYKFLALAWFFLLIKSSYVLRVVKLLTKWWPNARSTTVRTMSYASFASKQGPVRFYAR